MRTISRAFETPAINTINTHRTNVPKKGRFNTSAIKKKAFSEISAVCSTEGVPFKTEGDVALW